MNSIVYDSSQIGLRTVLREWQLKLLRIVWANKEGLNSRAANKSVNEALGSESISRASVINFLEDMREMGVLSGVEETGKGGYHWVYSPAMDESGFKRFIAEKLIGSLRNSFPDESSSAIEKLIK